MPSVASSSFLHPPEPTAAVPPDRAPSLANGSVASFASEQTNGDDLVDIPLQVPSVPDAARVHLVPSPPPLPPLTSPGQAVAMAFSH